MTDLPYEYRFDFSQGLGDWFSWMQPSVGTPEADGPGFVRLQAPGRLDPNHIDGIGALSLIAHLPIEGTGSPGILDLRDAEIDLTIRGTNFDPHGAKIVFWICSTLPDGSTRYDYPLGLQITNWANTGNDLGHQISDQWQTITVRLDDDPAAWTEAGNYRSTQGDWGARYAPLGLEQALSGVNATLHLVAISDTPDDRPTGFIDLAAIDIRTAHAATPVSGQPVPALVLRADEDGIVIGTLARTEDVAGDVRYAIVDGSVSHGTVTLDPLTGAFSFVPEKDFFGPDTAKGTTAFDFIRIDNGVPGDPLHALVYVTPRNDAPTTTNSNEDGEIARDAPFAYTLFSGHDVDGDRLTFRVVDGSVAHGTIALDAATGRYVFTPEAGYVGAAGFAYTVSDGQAESAARTVTLTVTDTPVIPTYQDAMDTLERGDLDLFVAQVIRLANDGDANASYHYGQWLAHGFFVTPDTAGAATFLRQGLSATPDAALQLAQLYIAGDGVARDYAEARHLLAGATTSAGAVFRLAMLDYLGLGGPLDTAQAATGFLTAAKMGHGEAMETIGRRYLAGDGVPASAEDAYFWLTTAIASGTFDGHDGPMWLLTHNRAQAAALLSPERIAQLDAAASSWTAGMPTPVNDAPTTSPGVETATGQTGTTITGTLLAGSDVDGDHLVWRLAATDDAHGDVTLDPHTGSFSYTAHPGFVGEARFSYVVDDGQAVSTAKDVMLTVTRTTSARDDAVTLAEGATIVRNAANGILANDTSRTDDAALAVVSVGGSSRQVGTAFATAYGTITIAPDGSFTYRADRAGHLTEGQQAIDIVHYEVANSLGDHATATLNIQVDGRGGTMLSGDGVLIGSRWDDRLEGSAGADYLVGGDGDDWLDGGIGAADALQGGTGNDTYVVHDGDSVIEFANEGIDEVRTELASYTLREHVERLVGTASTGQHLTGNALDNVIVGGSGDDMLIGGDGDDTLVGGSGNDVLMGGAGTDTVDYSTATGGVFVNLPRGQAQDGSGGIDTLIGIENIRGSAFADTIIGDDANNHIDGGAGADYLIGGAGDDWLDGGPGAPNALQGRLGNDVYIVHAGDTVIEFADQGIDEVRTAIADYALRDHVERLIGTASTGQRLTGNALDNVIVGGTGDDILAGGMGRDILTGGAGRDTFVLSARPGLTDADTITDFRPGEDRLALSSALPGMVPAGAMLTDSALTTVTAIRDADDRLLYDRGTGNLWYDVDGSGPRGALLLARLAKGLSLTASDFLVV